ncbi:hypothetical protein WJX73_002454 [Symbiochloris irregularis]|uniref:Chloride channel protein n=1 Tax=Symbiochloris irregularis TaxID=706552 RepID=A0AAW1NWC7_9CHLO
MEHSRVEVAGFRHCSGRYNCTGTNPTVPARVDLLPHFFARDGMPERLLCSPGSAGKGQNLKNLLGMAQQRPKPEVGEATRPGQVAGISERSTRAVGTGESLDYHTVYNVPHVWRQRHTSPALIFKIKRQTFLKLLATLTIGVLVGVMAVGMAICTENILAWKNAFIRQVIHDGHPFGIVRGCLVHVTFSVILTLAGCLMVQLWAPAAAASGVSLVIAYLNGNAIPGFLNARSLAVKWAGTVLSVSANLTVGPEAPMVHLGACMSHLVAHFLCVTSDKWQRLQQSYVHHRSEGGDEDDNGLAIDSAFNPLLEKSGHPKELPVLHSDFDRREFVCAGAAAGIAAAFGAPIGGVLFSMEEAATHWSRKMAWRCFLCTTVSVFTLAQLHPRWRNGVLSFQGVADMINLDWFHQFPFLVLVSMGGGLLGATFNWLRKTLLTVKAAPDNTRLRCAQGVAVAALTIALMFTLSYWVGTCVTVPDWQDYGYTFHCQNGQYNDLATLFLANQDDTIRRLFSMGSLSPQQQVCKGDNCYFTLRSLMMLAPVYLGLMSMAACLAIPGGLFTPSIIVGGSFGGTCGVLLMEWLPHWHIQPGVYAMCAAAAMLGGVFRASISLVVLLVEGTQSTKFMLGIITAVICSNWLGEFVHSDGVYETDLERDGTVIFLKPYAPRTLQPKSAEDVMTSEVWCFREVESLDFILGVLRRTTHNGFPVVRRTAPAGVEASSSHPRHAQDLGVTRKGELQGLILRSQILILISEREFCDEHGHPLADNAQPGLDRALELDRKMRTFYRYHFMHQRSMLTNLELTQSLLQLQGQLDGTADGSLLLQEAGRSASNASQDVGEGRDRQGLPCGGVDADAEGLRRPSLFVNLATYMDIAPPSVKHNTPAERAHDMFTSLGLRHLAVVDDQACVSGIITRQDLDHAAGPGAWRRNKVSARPASLPAQLRLGLAKLTSWAASRTFSSSSNHLEIARSGSSSSPSGSAPGPQNGLLDDR